MVRQWRRPAAAAATAAAWRAGDAGRSSSPGRDAERPRPGDRAVRLRSAAPTPSRAWPRSASRPRTPRAPTPGRPLSLLPRETPHRCVSEPRARAPHTQTPPGGWGWWEGKDGARAHAPGRPAPFPPMGGAAAPEQCACVLLTNIPFFFFFFPFPSSLPLPLPCRSRREWRVVPFPLRRKSIDPPGSSPPITSRPPPCRRRTVSSDILLCED